MTPTPPRPRPSQNPPHPQPTNAPGDPARSAGGAPNTTRPSYGTPRTALPADETPNTDRPAAASRNTAHLPSAGPSSPSLAPGAPPHPLRLAYGTNGLTDLRLTDALSLLSDLGYDGVALTLDHMHLDPLAPGLAARTAQVAEALRTTNLAVAIETGARYVLDPRRKHHPTLIDPDPDARAARADLLRTAVRIGADLGATAVHCFSGVRDAGSADTDSWQRLAAALHPVAEAAADAGLPLAVEPEPGHLLSDLAGFHHLRTLMGEPDPDVLGLTLDIGHCQCLEPLPPADCVRAAAPWTKHVQLEDMRRGVHEHLPFGDGEIDFPPVFAALRDTAYQGLVSVELPRHSHAGPAQARASLHFLRSHLPAPSPGPDRGPRSRRESRAPVPNPTPAPAPPTAPDAPPTPPPARSSVPTPATTPTPAHPAEATPTATARNGGAPC